MWLIHERVLSPFLHSKQLSILIQLAVNILSLILTVTDNCTIVSVVVYKSANELPSDPHIMDIVALLCFWCFTTLR